MTAGTAAYFTLRKLANSNVLSIQQLATDYKIIFTYATRTLPFETPENSTKAFALHGIRYGKLIMHSSIINTFVCV